MPPLEPINAPLLGRTAFELLLLNASWVHRRKETVAILDATWFRRQISIDYELPADLVPHRRGPSEELLFAVPITLMRKSPPGYVDFDMNDQSGSAMSLMTRAQNAAVSLEALRWAAARAAFGGIGTPLESDIDDLLRHIAEDDPISASLAFNDLQGRAAAKDPISERLLGDDHFMWLAFAFAEHSVVMVEVGAGDGRRRMVKLAYNERNLNRSAAIQDQETDRGTRGGLQPYPVFIDSPFIAAGTYHFELVPPVGLEVVDTSIREYGYLDARGAAASRRPYMRRQADPAQETLASLVRSGTRTHLYLSDAELTDRAEVVVLLRAQREGFLSTAAWLGTAIAVLLVFFLVTLGPVIDHQGVVPSILLLTPGFAAAVVGRSGEHKLTVRMLNLVRRALLVSAACVFVSAVGLALSRTGDGHEPTTLLWLVWIATTGTAIYCAVLLQIARVLPKRRRGKWDALLARAARPLTFLLDASFLRVRWRTLPRRCRTTLRATFDNGRGMKPDDALDKKTPDSA
jgi:hypothetical protein